MRVELPQAVPLQQAALRAPHIAGAGGVEERKVAGDARDKRRRKVGDFRVPGSCQDAGKQRLQHLRPQMVLTKCSFAIKAGVLAAVDFLAESAFRPATRLVTTFR